jgi:two-component system cell cycle sensor histidine kinase/response regulator CckA
MFFHQSISIVYTVINVLLAAALLIKAPRSLVIQFYVFCVVGLATIGVLAYWIQEPIDASLRTVLEDIIVFLFSLCPFFFIHFIIIFLRRYDILKSKYLVMINYAAGLFSYSMVLLEFIPSPVTPETGVTKSGVVFYMTWMSIYFTIGIALLDEMGKGFRDKVEKANLLLGVFGLLLLVLPGPFTESILVKILGFGIEWYFLSSMLALVATVYFVFRHKILVKTVYDALKDALSVMNDLFVTTDEKLIIQMARGTIVQSLGYTEKELIGKPLNEFLEQKYYLKEYLDFVNKKKMKESRFDADIIAKTGKRFPFNFSLTPIYSNEALKGFVSIGRDITDQKRAESIQNVVYKISQVSDNVTYLSDLLPAIHEILQDILPVKNISFALYDVKKNTLDFPYVVFQEGAPIKREKNKKDIHDYVVRLGKSFLCTRTTYEELVRRGEIETDGRIPSIWVGAPLIAERRIIGVISLHDFDDPFLYGEREQEMLDYVAVHIAKAIDQKRIEEEIHLLAHTMESIKEIVTITNLDHKFTFVNNAFVQKYGYSKEEIMGKHVSILWSKNNPPNVTESILRQTPLIGWRGMVLNVAKNGREFPVELSTSQIRDSSGKVVGLVGIAVDVTERQQAEVALRTSEKKFHDLFENVPSGVFQSTREGKFIIVNPALVRMLGYENVDELKDANIETNMYANPTEYKMIIQQLEQNKELHNIEVALKKKNGEIIYVLENVHAVYDTDGHIAYYEGTMTDITDRKNLEEQLRHSQKMESIGTLAGGIAHDFNNILQIILMYSSKLMKDNVAPEVLRESIDAINKSVQRGSGLIRQMLTFARKADAVYESINLNATIRDLTKMVSETFPKNIEYCLHLEQQIPSIIADRNQIYQVLLNLCINARDAMPNGGKLEVRTEVTSGANLRKKFPDAQEQHYACITISDSGMGMDEATRKRIFEPFFTTKEHGKGTGLGLAVVYGIIKSHNGFIDVKSEKGKGTTFRVYFPVQMQSIKYIESEEKKSISEIPGGSETLLVVEDEEIIAETLKSILEEKGYKILIEKDGVAAVESYAKNRDRISLVLMDVGLPKLDGWQAFLKMKEINPQVAVILASGYVDPHLKSERLERGVKDIIQKPYVPNVLLEKIRETLDKIKSKVQ